MEDTTMGWDSSDDIQTQVDCDTCGTLAVYVGDDGEDGPAFAAGTDHYHTKGQGHDCTLTVL
jgi:hypothetical protein